jgi:hypothetical protein
MERIMMKPKPGRERDMRSCRKGRTSSQQAERLEPQLLPPLVTPEGTSEICQGFVESIIRFMSPDLTPGCVSTLSDQKIEEYVAVSAIALAWHFTALSDLARRDEFLKGFADSTFGLMVATEAARAAIKNDTTIDQELKKTNREVGIAQESERYGERCEATATVHRGVKNTCRKNSRPRQLPLLAIPIWVSKRCRNLVVALFDQIDARTRPGLISAISDREVDERARACHLAMCWFLGALSTSDKGDQIALQWVDEVPRLVHVMMTSAASHSIDGYWTKH